MAATGLEDQLQELILADTDYLLFHRPDNVKYDDTPRYLFRVFTEYSQGSTDMTWAKSMDATNGTADRNVDLFSRDKQRTARMVNKHLRGEECKEDNLMSWTSSLLDALVYIFHLRAKNTLDVTFDMIYLCIVDTSNIPEGVFLRDLDLIHAYRQYCLDYPDLWNFNDLRRHTKRSGFSGHYYFGEYLSQGSLRIEGKSKIISAQSLIDQGLYNIRSEFQEYKDWPRRKSPLWAKPVIEMREPFYHVNAEQQTISDTLILKSALDIADLFGPRWKLPIAAHLVALAAPRIDGETMLAEFRTFPDDDRENCSPFKTKIAAYDTLPEVQQYDNIMRSVYRDYCLTQLKDLLISVKSHLRRANKVIEDISSTKEGLTLADDGWETTLKQLRNINSMSGKLRHDLINMSKSNFDDEYDETDKDSGGNEPLLS